MLEDPRIARMAKVLVEYSLEVKPGWMVTISSTRFLLSSGCRSDSSLTSSAGGMYVICSGAKRSSWAASMPNVPLNSLLHPVLILRSPAKTNLPRSTRSCYP